MRRQTFCRPYRIIEKPLAVLPTQSCRFPDRKTTAIILLDSLTSQGATQNRSSYEFEGQKVRLGAFPVSIETKAYTRLARNAGRSAMVALVRESLGGNKLILGVDRLDYSKGIPDRVKAFERLLENNPEWRGNVILLQVTPKSRSDIKQYGDIESELTGLIGKVNGQYGDAAWTPIRYVNRSHSRTVLAGLYRAADVAW